MARKFKKILIANRGEIAIRVIRACKELGIRSVAIYTEEDKNALFRSKADEAYLIGKDKGPIEAYLDIEGIIKLAKHKAVDAIHPGYGFLSENSEFARRCAEEGIEFIGPTAEMMENLGDKIQSKLVAHKAEVPTIPGIEKPVKSIEEGLEYAKTIKFPVMIKAAAGGGGRGMRIARSEEEFVYAFKSAKSEAKKAFGIDDIFIEKFLENPKHIEVQILGDKYGNIVHLYERDCSVQRRHQKVVEFTPALTLSKEKRDAICNDALKIARVVKYQNAGTMEFLVDQNGDHYFIEMNPRVQVEHTITEMTTGIDIVQSQILIAEGHRLDSSEIGIKSQEDIVPIGYSIQCRVTTEDPKNNFAPDTGKIEVYRTGSGFGVRLDGGNGYAGAEISPYYDSLLVKVITHGRTFEDVVKKSLRALKEIKIVGVKTNIDFLINVLNHTEFKNGTCNTNFIGNHPELFEFKEKKDYEYHMLKFIGEKVVNETHGIKKDFDVPIIPDIKLSPNIKGTKQILDERGPEGVVNWIKAQKKLLLTDTTLRDAHQSLIATRVRTIDMLKIATPTAMLAKDLFSLEAWGGATFDVSYRFLKENPWKRLREIRKRVPNIMLQMLIRGSNAVGYKNYPDNVIREFIRKAAENGVDVFRIFDSLNWIKGMEVAIDEVKNQGKIAEACICYTGDILNPKKNKYTLEYYIKKAKEIEDAGAHILGIKDMSALLKPYAAYKLVKALKENISLPIHLHTHDTTGNGVATILMATEAGVDIVDTAFSAMSGLTSQPSLDSVVAALENTDRDTGVNLKNIQKISDYWSAVRPVYEKFESDLKSGTTEIYRYEIPGGQYSNLKPQVESFGLGDRFDEVKEMFKYVNDMLGDIVKVTPSSKMVGDLAIFMVQNGLTPNNILEKGKDLAFPDSVVAYFKGMMGQPEFGFPEDLQKIVLKGEKPITCRPGELLEPENFEKIKEHLKETHNIEPTEEDIISYALYPDVFDAYLKYIKENGDFSVIGSDVYFHGLSEGEITEIKIKEGKTLSIKLVSISKIDNEGFRTVSFEVNGNRRDIKIKDITEIQTLEKIEGVEIADPNNPFEIGASIPGTITKILVKEGDTVEENQSLIVIEAMKMETNITAKSAGVVDRILIKEGKQVKSGELLIELK
ncbi:pyruvate carboxylase [Hypnocyclicus thermotrophus]|uniref:Pyruvate carboxylase n=1 Tax=Hypnocyclicus thermotrophus TaxID=1627895 RepID=A0AA46E0C0_9FUSO|nr:pyruvate carboxylase [Hypnocyclicus thermotrophus]TDT71991.1 pyruvate carboxylase [Hypnocyclicus thermotrophus]